MLKTEHKNTQYKENILKYVSVKYSPVYSDNKPNGRAIYLNINVSPQTKLLQLAQEIKPLLDLLPY